jgi:hypothetical protein
MTITTTFVTVLRRFKYLAEKVMYSNHYNPYEMILQQELHGVFIPELKGVWKLMVEINFEHLI